MTRCPRRWFRGHVWRATAPPVPHTSAVTGRATLVHREACARCGETRMRVVDAPTDWRADDPAHFLGPIGAETPEQLARLKAEFEARHRGTAPASLIEPMYPGAACVLTVPPRDGPKIQVPGVSKPDPARPCRWQVSDLEPTYTSQKGYPTPADRRDCGAPAAFGMCMFHHGMANAGDTAWRPAPGVSVNVSAIDGESVAASLASPEGRAAIVAAIGQVRLKHSKEAPMPTESTPEPDALLFCAECGARMRRRLIVKKFDARTGAPLGRVRVECAVHNVSDHDGVLTPEEQAEIHRRWGPPTPEQLRARTAARARWWWRCKAGVLLAMLLTPAVWAGWTYAPASFARWRAASEAEAALCRTATWTGQVRYAFRNGNVTAGEWWRFSSGPNGLLGDMRREPGDRPPHEGDPCYRCVLGHLHLGTPERMDRPNLEPVAGEPPAVTPVREAAGGEEF